MLRSLGPEVCVSVCVFRVYLDPESLESRIFKGPEVVDPKIQGARAPWIQIFVGSKPPWSIAV